MSRKSLFAIKQCSLPRGSFSVFWGKTILFSVSLLLYSTIVLKKVDGYVTKSFLVKRNVEYNTFGASYSRPSTHRFAFKKSKEQQKWKSPQGNSLSKPDQSYKEGATKKWKKAIPGTGYKEYEMKGPPSVDELRGQWNSNWQPPPSSRMTLRFLWVAG